MIINSRKSSNDTVLLTFNSVYRADGIVSKHSCLPTVSILMYSLISQDATCATYKFLDSVLNK